MTSAVDSTGARAARFMVSSFVPVVGGALGEALGTITGCVKMIKSGVTAFGLLAEGALFLPVLLECVLWPVSYTHLDVYKRQLQLRGSINTVAVINGHIPAALEIGRAHV